MATRCARCSRWLTSEETGLPCPRCGSMDRDVFALEQAVVDDKAKVAQSWQRSIIKLRPACRAYFASLVARTLR